MKKPIKIIIILLVIIVVGIGGYFGYRLFVEKKNGNGKGKTPYETKKPLSEDDKLVIALREAFGMKFGDKELEGLKRSDFKVVAKTSSPLSEGDKKLLEGLKFRYPNLYNDVYTEYGRVKIEIAGRGSSVYKFLKGNNGYKIIWK